MIKNVLVAIDGSENSDKALDFSLDLAEKYSAAVTILNVSSSPQTGAVPIEAKDYSGDTMVAVSKDFRDFHNEILSKAVAKAKAAKPSLEISSKLREGDAASEIVDAIKEGNFDVLVVGHKGVGRVKEFLGLGGISDKVAHLAPCSVIIVR